jgi:hypothetical protein
MDDFGPPDRRTYVQGAVVSLIGRFATDATSEKGHGMEGRFARPDGWRPAPPSARCNFHPARDAVRVFAGTPVCEECRERLGGAEPVSCQEA